MARRRRFSSNTVRTVGALLPSDVLSKAMEGEGLEGLAVEAYGFDSDARLRDVVNDAWNEAKGHWWKLQSELRDLPDDDLTATALTRERWLLPLLELLGFDDVEVLSSAIEVGGTDYSISHMWHSTPLHLMGARVELDKRVAGVRGAARLSPHSLAQQFLNRSDDHLWAIVTNGKRLRILRDSVSLTRQAFVEFDLEAMFNGEVFPDFVLLYKVAHATRFAGDRPEDCLLERWIAAARDEGIRALEQLRKGVETALTTLGTGFLGHRDNQALRDAVDTRDLDSKEMYRHLLRLIYRLLFLFVAEDRDLLLVPDASPEARDRYDRFYSTARLRELASRPTGSGHSDLWEGLTALMDVLGRDEGEPSLGLSGMGSFLWSSDAIGPLSGASLDNEDLLVALRGLAYVLEDGVVRRIDFAAMGAEELGSVYESLLELHPSIDMGDRTFVLGGGAGSERKTTGSYYTPTELISELLDSALDPVLAEAAAKDDPERAILNLKVVDPAVGSGHFLVAAAHRIGKRLAEVRTGEPEPPAEAYRTAVRDVVSRCLYAVDLNDLAVELCKVSLWLEALEPGKPLSFLDHHILVGNSLFGATPAAIAGGIPDDAFVALTGDDKDVVKALKARNKKERGGQESLVFDDKEAAVLGSELLALEEFDDTDLETVRAKERMLAEWKASPAYDHAHLVADTWCAAFAIEKTAEKPALAEAVFRRVRDDGVIDDELHREVEQLRDEYAFLHWHLAFPQVFRVQQEPSSDAPGWQEGFDVVLGNPPWERVKLQEKEFFGPVSPEIARAPNKAARAWLVERLKDEDLPLWRAFQRAIRFSEVASHFLRKSGLYPLCGRGDVNTYAVFAELGAGIVGLSGRAGLILPTGIATDFTTRYFFSDLLSSSRLVSVLGFQNEAKLFLAIDHRIQFCLLTLTGGAEDSGGRTEFAFFLHRASELGDPGRTYTLTESDIQLLNPNTFTAPVFRTETDAKLVKQVYREVPALVSIEFGDPWGIEFGTMFHMSNDSHIFVDPSCDEYLTADESRALVPLYEAKMIHLFDHRFGTYEGQTEAQRRQGKLPELTDVQKADPNTEPLSRYCVPLDIVSRWLARKESTWMIGWREITGSTVLRTVVCSALPAVGVGHKILLIFSNQPGHRRLCLLANLGSFVLDYGARQKIGSGGMSMFIMKQLPVLPPKLYSQRLYWLGSQRLDRWIASRVFELTYTSWSMSQMADELQRQGPPFSWNPHRRDQIRSELDAAFFHLYALERGELDYIMETFSVLKKNDQSAFGSYRTKELILDVYDRMAKAIETGEPYQTLLDPPPADPSLRVDVDSPR